MASCASVNFNHSRFETPPPRAAISQAVPGDSDLEHCLLLMGAPTSVEPAEDGQSFVLTWDWLEISDWGFNVSIPIGDRSASFNWQDSDQQPQYVRLFFDRDWMLVGKAEG